MDDIKKVTPKKRKKFTFKRAYFSFPYMILAIVFVVVPLLILFGYSLLDENGNISFDNFIYFFSYSENIVTMLYSMLIALVTTAICLVIAYPLAMCLASSKINKSMILVLLFILPMWVNTLLRTYALQNLLIDLFGMDRGITAAIIGLVYDFMPFMLLPLYSIMANMDKSVIEASYDLGAGHIKTFTKVKLPLSVSGIMSGVLMVFMPTMSTFAITEIMGGPNTYLIGSMIYDHVNGGDWGGSAAISMILLALVGIVMFISNIITKGRTEPVSLGGVL